MNQSLKAFWEIRYSKWPAAFSLRFSNFWAWSLTNTLTHTLTVNIRSGHGQGKHFYSNASIHTTTLALAVLKWAWVAPEKNILPRSNADRTKFYWFILRNVFKRKWTALECRKGVQCEYFKQMAGRHFSSSWAWSYCIASYVVCNVYQAWR